MRFPGVTNPLAAVAAVLVLAVLVVAAQRPVGSGPAGNREKPAKPYPTRAGTLPPGVRVIDEPDGFEATRDVLPGKLVLPSGRVAIDAYFAGETQPLDERAPPGSYPFHITEAKSVRGQGRGVALATLVISDRPTVGWEAASSIGVDGGTAAFSSAEGAQELGDLLPGRAHRWEGRYEEFSEVMAAHRAAVGLADVDDEANLAMFATGLGDGGYNAYVGLDASGRPTQFVLDCGLIHFDWPVERKPATATAQPA